MGTKSAILALTNYGNAILKSYSDGKDWAQVVQGFDMDSDGKIDNVDVLEEILYFRTKNLRQLVWVRCVRELVVLPLALQDTLAN